MGQIKWICFIFIHQYIRKHSIGPDAYLECKKNMSTTYSTPQAIGGLTGVPMLINPGGHSLFEVYGGDPPAPWYWHPINTGILTPQKYQNHIFLTLKIPKNTKSKLFLPHKYQKNTKTEKILKWTNNLHIF